MKIFIIIPAYNEGDRVYRVIADIQNNLQLLTYNLQLVIVDDGSTDDTFDQAFRTGVKILKHIVNRGQGAALVTGTKYALSHGADLIVHFDADGQHETMNILKLVQPIINKRVDVVLGSRFLETAISHKLSAISTNNLKKILLSAYSLLLTKDIPLSRRFFILGNLAINTFLTGVFLTDAHNGLRALSADAAEKINITQDRMAHATEYIQEIKRLDLSYKEISVNIKYRQVAKKSQGFFDGVKILKELFLGKLTK